MGGIDLLNLDLSVVIQLVLFLALVFIMNKYMFSPMVKVLSKRRQEMDQALKGDPLEDEAVEKERIYNDRLQKLRGEGARLLNRTRGEAKVEEHRLIDGAKKEISDSAVKSRAAIVKEMEKAKQEVSDRISVLASEVASKIVGRNL